VAILKIAQVGTPVLRERAKELTADELARSETQQFIDDLVETMRDANGAGLAAPQVYKPIRVVAIEVRGNNPRYPYKPPILLTVVVNPIIEVIGDEMFDNYEGCLSVPNLRGVVARHAEVKVTGLDRHGQPFERIARGLTAGTFQHECDHVDGVLFLDRVKDPRTLATWAEFDRYHKDAFVARIKPFIERMGG
jgi:peptide deformylase